MSTISQAPKTNTASTLNIRNASLLVVAALIVAVVVFFTSVAGSPTAAPVDNSAYLLYRQGEWLSVPIPVNNAEAYQIFRSGEVTSPLTNAEAYRLFRLGEWASMNVPAITVDMTAYHLSERTLVDADAGFAIYLLSERTLIDPQAGMAIYLNSERTSTPARFTKYQLSEWFAK